MRRHNQTTEWKNVRGSISLECELEIRFLSSGSHTPMSMYGGPDNLGWPEEGDDERLLEKVVLTITTKLGAKVSLPLGKIEAEAIFAAFQDYVDEAELEHDGGPDE